MKIERMQWLRIFAPGSRRCSEVFYNILSIAKVIVTKSKAGLANRLRHLLKYLDFLSLTISIFKAIHSEVLHLGNIKFDAPPNNSEGQKLL